MHSYVFVISFPAKLYVKLGTLVISHTLGSPIALREFLLSVILFSTASSHVLYISSPNIFVRSIFTDSSNFVYSFTGYIFCFIGIFLILIFTLLASLDKYDLFMALILIYLCCN